MLTWRLSPDRPLRVTGNCLIRLKTMQAGSVILTIEPQGSVAVPSATAELEAGLGTPEAGNSG